MSYVIQCRGWANKSFGRCPYYGHYVTGGDHNALDGKGYFDFSPHIGLAMLFPSQREALEFWQRQSTIKPYRPDGKPNRPLTAMHAEIILRVP
jgi:hypothetical protein